MNPLSQRILNIEESATIAMSQKARDYKAKGIDVISLSLGEPDFKTPKHIQQGAKDAIDEGKYFAYPPIPGYADLREAIARKFQDENNIGYQAEHIVVSNGAKQSLANLFLCLLDPGDEVIIYSPYWVTYPALVKLVEGVPVFIKGGLEDDFKATAQQLESAITSKTKAVIFSSPCNPTGSVFSQEELQSIADVLKNHKHVYAIADEIYEHINYTGKHVSLASIPGMFENTITVNGFAKGFAMTGWRVGYIGAPTWLAKACTKIQGQLTSANCSISQRAALVALSSDMEPTYEMARQYSNRRDLVSGLLQEIPGIKVNEPKGAFYFFPDVSEFFGKSYGGKAIGNSNDLSMFLLDDAHVSLVPGEAFGAPDCIRISYAASEENLKEALGRIKEALAKLS